MPLDLTPRLDEILTPRLREVALSTLRHFAEIYGTGKIFVDTEIRPDIPWRPTFFIKPNKLEYIGVEVEQIVYPEALKICGIDLRQANVAVSAYAVCPLEVAQADKNEEHFKALCAHGFGFGTVDEDLQFTKKHGAIPQQQFIPEEDFAEILRPLPQSVRHRARSAYETYKTNPVQGVQEISQLPETLIWRIVDHGDKKGWLVKAQISNNVGLAIGDLLACNNIRNARPSLGVAADFFSNFRNKVSHTPTSAKKNAERMKNCRDGFKLGIRASENLIQSMKEYQISTRMNF